MEDYAEQVKQLEQQIRQRADQLVAQDPLCNRFVGRLDVLRQLIAGQDESKTPVLKVEKGE